ncbi:hypothetical protein IEQ44_01170 [Nocardioides sp. Y6]|uniref:Transposase n=1 Tax=Nocardioides malaquae TaxID=2773426 RepID=A0ABR9RNW7_9ACTN|nr:hypothetical protein [Nocardioides malaquae]MBE7323262.1 hypothetical protein [Nocardioides malaquae]
MEEQERTERLLAEADDLYALPTTDFTLARDRRAAELKAEDGALAGAVKALRKPTVAAWVVNLFVRREAAEVDQLLDLGVALRDAQEALDGDELRALSRQRRQVTAAMASRARSVAAAEGQKLSQSVTDQVEATFTAALLDEQAAAALRSGLLVQPITVTGVEVPDLSGAVALASALGFSAPPREAPHDDASAQSEEVPPRPALRLVPDPERSAKQRRAAKQELADAERALARAARARRSAQRHVDDLQARLLRVRSEADELRRRLADLETEADEVEEELGDAEAGRDETDEELAVAESERDEAAAALARLDDD